MKPITKENFLAIRNAEGSHRKIFSEHSGIQKRKAFPTFSVNFPESIAPIYQAMTQNHLVPNQKYGNYYHFLNSQEEIEVAEQWEKEMGNYVFLKDCLFTSIALDMNQTTTPQQTIAPTKLGAMFKMLKYEVHPQGIEEGIYEKVTSELISTIKKLPFYKDAKYIACVPPSPGKQVDIPSNLVQRIADKLNLTNITGGFSFSGKKESAKNLSKDEKWDAWEQAGLKMNYDLNQKDVILIDDLYQSGTTVNYTAMVLRRANAGRILGLYVVKSMRDTDNQ